MRLFLDDYQPPEMAIVRDEDAIFAFGDSQDVVVGQARGVVNGDRGDIVPQPLQERRETHIDAFVEEEPHTSAGASSARCLAAANASLR